MGTEKTDREAQAAARVPLGYLVSQYPAVNHTFILREIRTLRRLGLDIVVVSIRNSDRRLETLSEEEAEEFRRTYSVNGAGPGKALLSNFRTLLHRPVAYLSVLLYALRLAGGNIGRLVPYLIYFAQAVVVGDFLTRARVRHVHTHFSSTVALILARLFEIEFSITIHGPDEFNNVVGFHMAEKVARAKFIATISHFAASQTMRACPPQVWDKVHVLPLGVDPSEFSPQPRSTSSRASEVRILCVGRLAPAKAYHMLIAAIARLVSQGRTNVLLTLVGEGPARASLEKMIARDNLSRFVRLAGACNHDRVIDFYRETDIFALASFAEGVPIVLMEAMVMQIPCVATWIAGIPELIRSEVDGLLVPPADPDALATAIARLIDDPDLCRLLGQSARVRVLEHYHLAHNTERLAEVFCHYQGISAPAVAQKAASIS